METLEIKEEGEQVIITYIENVIDEDGYIKSRSKNETGTINSSHGMVNRVSDLLNNPDFFLEYTNSYGTESILAKNVIQYVALALNKETEIINADVATVTIELINGLKFQGEVDLCGTIKIKHLFENKSFIPLMQVNINRTLLINRRNIKKIEEQKKMAF